MDTNPVIIKHTPSGSVEVKLDVLDKMQRRQKWQSMNSSIDGVLAYMRELGRI
nr:MAG TPA: hypothetical protein [Caudoviricetes sp.]